MVVNALAETYKQHSYLGTKERRKLWLAIITKREGSQGFKSSKQLNTKSKKFLFHRREVTEMLTLLSGSYR